MQGGVLRSNWFGLGNRNISLNVYDSKSAHLGNAGPAGQTERR